MPPALLDPTGPTGDTGDTGPTGPTGPIGGSDGEVLYNNGGVAAGSNIFFDASNNRVGIGTTSPDPRGLLHVQKSSGPGGILISNSGTTSGDPAEIIFTRNATAFNIPNSAAIGMAPGRNMFILVNGQDRLNIDTFGNVGIGTPTPGSKLVVVSPDDNGSTEVVKAISNNGNQSTSLTFTGLRSNIGAGLGFSTNGSTSFSLSIDTSGNVGIGTPTPGSKLVVVSPDDNGSTEVVKAISNNGNQSTSLTFTGLRSNVGAGLGFSTNGSTSFSLSIDTFGNVGIGTISPQDKLQVEGNIAFPNQNETANFHIGRWVGSTTPASTNRIIFGGAGENSLTFHTHRAGVSNQDAMHIDGVGNVGIGTPKPEFPVGDGQRRPCDNRRRLDQCFFAGIQGKHTGPDHRRGHDRSA